MTDDSGLMARFLDLADDAIISVDQHLTVVQFNQGAERIFGYAAEDTFGQPLDIFLPPHVAERHRQHIETFAQCPVAARRMGERSAIRGRRKDGSEFPAEASICKVAANGELMFTVIMRDVTERTLAEDRIRASLEEKEVLLKEVHHRVKNNLQVISSLLGLQARSIADELTRRKFEESQHRVQSMAMLHETLYQSEKLVRIDVAQYLDLLVNELFRFYGAGPGVRLEAELEPLQLDMDTAVPFGLIVNELVSNSLKYGFPRGRQGLIRIALRSLPEARARLLVADDGTGLPSEFDWKSTPTLGLRLVRTLAQQLNADVHLDRGGGTAFTICFPLADTPRGKGRGPWQPGS